MKKFAIIYGDLSATQRVALGELSKMLLDYTFEYPVCLKYSEQADLSEYKAIYIGTKESNPYIKNTSKVSLNTEEEYNISVKNSTVIIEGFDDAGVLYGTLDFYNKYVVKFEHPDTDEYVINFLTVDSLPDFDITSSPRVKERGLWTWGHVIYDYRGYLDNMMKLKLNRIIIWNDYVPVNAEKIISYAHERNIRVIWGFPWLWDTDCNKFDIENLDGYSEEIFAKYESEYANIGGDGIYFQTFTELPVDNIQGVVIADAATKFVNRTAGIFYKKYPDLEIQFGLHATSVKEKLEFIKNVDPRIRIVWENCGSFPFSYIPKDVSEFKETKNFVRKIARLRGAKDRFGVVTKGLVKLDWSQFEHPKGSQNIGVSSEHMKQNRIERKKKIWRYIQAYWLTYAHKAHEMVKEIYALKNGNLCVFALVEDGMFEENIMYPVALYSEMLWDSFVDTEKIMSDVALRSYVSFA